MPDQAPIERRIAEIKARRAAITPPPYRWYVLNGELDDDCKLVPTPIDPLTYKTGRPGGGPVLLRDGDGDHVDREVLGAGSGEYIPYNRPEDAVFFQKAPEDVEFLLALVEVLLKKPTAGEPASAVAEASEAHGRKKKG